MMLNNQKLKLQSPSTPEPKYDMVICPFCCGVGWTPVSFVLYVRRYSCGYCHGDGFRLIVSKDQMLYGGARGGGKNI